MIGKKYIFKDECLPLLIEDGVVYVCKSDKIVHFKCPCGCDSLIILPILDNKTIHPNWMINGNSITPSINRQVGCRSHFTITNGTVH